MNFWRLSESALGRKNLKTFKAGADSLVALDWFEDNADKLDHEDWREVRWRLTQYMYSLMRKLEKSRLHATMNATRWAAEQQATISAYMRFAINVTQGIKSRLPDSLQDLDTAEKWLERLKTQIDAMSEFRGHDFRPQARKWVTEADAGITALKNVLPRMAHLDARFPE